ncbi:hypothetical protein P280DRAFT_198024 [Massarina eburnea CBS 473.64]|uniref:F-box domain-containing protein n=1 Tax=Massarina eburnea CBS 473.64 TaxID=1395130 RepID=A0A6A6RIU4_9PLEO|nr:hypothetical protein P280DRAFT_198024 [Massarina eburnea CBS 473.64]
MRLIDLPLEMLDNILDLSLPSGLEGLALSCKAMYERATPQIRRHNELRRKWRRTSNHQGQRIDDTLPILYEISREPIVAEYIEELDLWDDRDRYDDEGIIRAEATAEKFRKGSADSAAVREMITKSLRSYDADVDARGFWKDTTKADLSTEDEGFAETPYTVIALLSLLPNIHTLRLPSWWVGTELEARAVLEAMVAAVSGDNRYGRPLSKLKTILPSMHAGYEEKMGLKAFMPLLTLKSLTEVYLVSAVAVDDGYTGMPFQWTAAPGIASSLTHIELVSCCMDADGISGLVAHTPALTVFKYSHETKYHGCQHDWNPGTFAEALAHYCGNTITEVALTIDELYGAIINGASSFRSFPKLEKLEVDIQVFCGPPVESGQRGGDDAFIPDGDTPWSEHDIPCIGSMLPVSIREVQINVDNPEPDEEALHALLKNLKQQRMERLHLLERVIIRQYGGSSALEMATDAGATLESFDRDLDRRMDMPEWKRKFHDRVRRLEPMET